MSDTPAPPTAQEIEDLIDGFAVATWANLQESGCKKIAAALRHQRDRIAALEGALRQCADQFQFYADEHTRAGKAEKAATNQRFADLARKAIGHE